MSPAPAPWHITDPNPKASRQIVAADGSVVAKLTVLDMDNAHRIVAAVNAVDYVSSEKIGVLARYTWAPSFDGVDMKESADGEWVSYAEVRRLLGAVT